MASSSQRGKRLYRILAWFIGVIVAMIGLGIGYQYGSQSLDRRAIHAPGEFIQVNDANLHLYCTGEGSPTVVLEAGAMGFAQTWAWIQSDLAEVTRVCSYDRAGMGWSEPSLVGHDGTAIAHNLKVLLDQANVPAPYILVGHSLGGSFVEIFASLYPDDVIALGLVDPTHPNQLDELPPVARQRQDRTVRILQPLSVVANVGIVRVTNVLGRLWQGLPDLDYRAARLFMSSPQHLRNSRSEYLQWDATMEAVQKIDGFDDMPLLVISSTAGLSEEMLAVMHRLHTEMATMSVQGQWVMVEGADHFSLLANHDHASATALHLQTLIEEVRNRSVAE